jgi:hypothetical protein
MILKYFWIILILVLVSYFLLAFTYTGKSLFDWFMKKINKKGINNEKR